MTTDIDFAAADIETRIQNEIHKAAKHHDDPTTIVETGPIVTDLFPAATLTADDNDLGTTWDLGAGLTLTTSWRYATSDESGMPVVDVEIKLDGEVAAERKADAEATMRANHDEAIAALSRWVGVNLADPDAVIYALDDSNILAWRSSQNPDEFGIVVDIDNATNRVVLSCWCWDPTNLDAVDQGDVLTVDADVALATAAEQLAQARQQLATAERTLATTAAAAQEAGSATWQDIAGILGQRSRQAAQEWVARKLP